ncbi:MAG TPA: glycosyltransferase family 1 protein [Alphaproteobacteria bacterium]|nr:glycosyltransferase family 1 protein [Alphaproteobacteria bacterium]
MRILIISDAWHPQVNGVVRTLEATAHELDKTGHQVKIAGPQPSWRALRAPTYPDIRLEFFARSRLRRLVEDFRPDFIHIATEGPLGWAGRNVCLEQRRPFTTSYHTRFPEYLATRAPRFLSRAVRIFVYAGLRRFHAPAGAVMVATPSIEDELRRRKFRRLVRWTRGVDTDLFRPYGKDVAAYAGLPRPVLLYVGRVAVEKNLRAFLDLKTEGSKIVIGDGPDLPLLRAEYPGARFLGPRADEDLARHYAAADLFVFPSTTDTFGLVLLEACAAGLRIAGYPAPGPVDLFVDPAARTFAALDTDLNRAVAAALALPDNPEAPRGFAMAFSWQASSRQFFAHLQAPTPLAIKRIARLRVWLSRWWQHALTLAFKHK